ncbi:MAG: ABC transporter substrate-binding protein, partial [Pseudomonadota bacterium]
MKSLFSTFLIILSVVLSTGLGLAEDVVKVPAVDVAKVPVKIGLNYPKTGPYKVQGLDQLQAAELAVEEINSAGGIL